MSMETYCSLYENICCRLPHPVQWCDKIGFCCFSCFCLCIPNCIDYFFDNGENMQKGLIIHPTYSYDDFIMNDALDTIH